MSAPAQTSFTTVQGGAYAEVAVGIHQVGSLYRTAVRTYDPGSGYRAELRTFNAQGMLQATAVIGPPGQVFIQSMEPIAGGGAYVVGSVIPPSGTDQDLLVMKLNSTYTMEWACVPAMPEGQVLYAASVLADGSVVATGATAGPDKHDALVIRVSASGALQWSSSVAGPLDEEGLGIAAGPAEVMITGRQVNFGGTTDCLFALLDLNGSVTWVTSWGGIRDDDGRALARTAGGTFVMAGRSNSYSAYNVDEGLYPDDVYFIAIDTNGDTLWTRTVGDTLFSRTAETMRIATNGDLFLAGERWTAEQRDALVMRLSGLGAPIWERAYDLGRQDLPLDIRTLANGAVACGWTFNAQGQQVMLLRMDALGN